MGFLDDEVFPRYEELDNVQNALDELAKEPEQPTELAARAIALARAFGITKQAVELACRRRKVSWIRVKKYVYITLKSWADWKGITVEEILEKLSKPECQIRPHPHQSNSCRHFEMFLNGGKT